MERYKINILIFIAGFIGGLIFNNIYKKPCPEITTSYSSITTTETTQTADEVNSSSNAVIEYIKKPAIASSTQDPTPRPCPENKGGDVFTGYEAVAKWDTVTSDGFVARIRYYTQQERFENYFRIPKTYTKTTFTELKENSITHTKLPDWEFITGFNALYHNKLLTEGYGYFKRNMNLYGNVYTSLGAGSVYEIAEKKFHPAVNFELRIGF